MRAAATARNVSRTASGGHAALANEFVALSVQARPQLPAPRSRGNLKSGDRDLKRGIRVCGFGLEWLPWPGDGLFASACLARYLARSAGATRE